MGLESISACIDGLKVNPYLLFDELWQLYLMFWKCI